MASNNNGGSTDYYKINRKWKDCADIMEVRGMNYNQGNIFKVAFTFNIGRHDGTTYERELNKVIYFAERELARIKLEGIECKKEKKLPYIDEGIPECSNPACVVNADNPLGLCVCENKNQSKMEL